MPCFRKLYTEKLKELKEASEKGTGSEKGIHIELTKALKILKGKGGVKNGRGRIESGNGSRGGESQKG